MKRRLVAAIACRNQGARLYGKPVQNLDVEHGIRIIDNIIACLKTIECIDEIVLGISEGVENEVFKAIAEQKGLRYVVGDQVDVLSRLVNCGLLAGATDATPASALLRPSPPPTDPSPSPPPNPLEHSTLLMKHAINCLPVPPAATRNVLSSPRRARE